LTEDPHRKYQKIHEDVKRDKYLESLGFTVLRFENRFVPQEPEYLKDEIRKVINKKRTDLINQSTTPAATSFCDTLTSIVLRPPLLQKEGKVL
jgi:hypothetical protein